MRELRLSEGDVLLPESGVPGQGVRRNRAEPDRHHLVLHGRPLPTSETVRGGRPLHSLRHRRHRAKRRTDGGDGPGRAGGGGGRADRRKRGGARARHPVRGRRTRVPGVEVATPIGGGGRGAGRCLSPSAWPCWARGCTRGASGDATSSSTAWLPPSTP